MATFSLQRSINEYRAEPLTAILPGVALAELWDVLGMVENMLIVIAFLVLLATLVGMTTTLLSSMKERQRELARVRRLLMPLGEEDGQGGAGSAPLTPDERGRIQEALARINAERFADGRFHFRSLPEQFPSEVWENPEAEIWW